MIGLTRRSAIAGALACIMAACITAQPAAAAPTARLSLEVSPTRSTEMTTWIPGTVRGVVLFSTGHGSWPDRYDAIAQMWRKAGFVVLAPLHVDSMRHPDAAKFSREASFGERLADMRAASGYAAKRWPGKPVAAAGHSFGTLTALSMAGALARMGPFRDPSVKAVLGFSTPGKIPGLIAPDTYAGAAVPTMIITGDKDLVPGLVADWHDHLFPVQTAPPGDRYAVVLAGADHEVVGGARPALFSGASRAGVDFLDAYLLGDRKAKLRLASPARPGETWTRR